MKRKAAITALFVVVVLAIVSCLQTRPHTALASNSSTAQQGIGAELVDMPVATIIAEETVPPSETLATGQAIIPASPAWPANHGASLAPREQGPGPAAPLPAIAGCPTIRFSLKDHPGTTLWSLWSRTSSYRRSTSFDEFKSLFARINGCPNNEAFYRRMGPHSFPRGVVLLPEPRQGTLWDYRSPPRPKTAGIPIPAGKKPAGIAKVTAASPSAVFQATERELKEISSQTVQINQRLDRLSATAKNIPAIDRKVTLLNSQVTRMEQAVTSLTAAVLSLTKTDIPGPVKASFPRWSYGLLAIALIAAILSTLFMFLYHRKRESFLFQDRESLRQEFTLLKKAIPLNLEPFIVRREVVRDLFGVEGECVVLLEKEGDDSRILLPPCGNPPNRHGVKIGNMSSHIRSCAACQNDLRRRFGFPARAHEEATAHVPAN